MQTNVYNITNGSPIYVNPDLIPIYLYGTRAIICVEESEIETKEGAEYYNQRPVERAIGYLVGRYADGDRNDEHLISVQC